MNNEMTTDNMSNEEVIEVLKGIVFNGFDRTTRKERQALDLAIKALEERPQGDLISREALKKAIKDNGYSHYFEIFDIIDNAPTIEPFERIGSICEENCGYNPQGEYVDISKLRLMTVEECAGHTIDYAMGWKACIDWIKKGGGK